MPVVRTRSRRVKSPEELQNGKPLADGANNCTEKADSASMKSMSDSGVDVCQEREPRSASRRQPLKRKQQQLQQNPYDIERKKRRVTGRPVAQQLLGLQDQTQEEPARRGARASSAKKNAEPLSGTKAVKHTALGKKSAKNAVSDPAPEVTSKRRRRVHRAKVIQEDTPDYEGTSMKTLKQRGKPSASPAEKKKSDHEKDPDGKILSHPTGRPKRSTRASRVSGVVKVRIPKGHSDEESDVESETDFSDNDDDDFVLSKSDVSEEGDRFPGKASEKSDDALISTGGSLAVAERVEKIREFLDEIEAPRFSQKSLVTNPAKVNIHHSLNKQVKGKTSRSKSGKSSKTKSNRCSDADDGGEEFRLTKPESSRVKNPKKSKRSHSSSDESEDAAPNKKKTVKKAKTANPVTQKKTFTKPRRAPKPKMKNERGGFGSFELSLLKLAKQMDDSDESEDEAMETAPSDSQVKTEEGVAGTATCPDENPEDEVEKKRLIMSMLKEHEEVDDMSDDDDSDEDVKPITVEKTPAATVKTESVDVKEIKKEDESPVKIEAKKSKGAKAKDEQPRKSRVRKGAVAATKKKDGKKRAASKNEELEESSGSDDEDDFEVVKERDPNYQRPENVTVVLQNEDFLPEAKKLSMEQRMVRIINQKRKASYLLAHRVHLLALLGHQRYLNSILDDENVKAHALSRVPPPIVLSEKKQKDSQVIKQILLFYKSAFELIASDEVFNSKLLKANLMKLLLRKTTPCNIVYMFGLLVLLRASGIRARLCLSYHLLPHKAPLLRIKDGEIVELGSKKKASETDYGIADFFIEVYLSDKKRWRPIDIEGFSVIDDPHELTPHLEQPVAFLIGIDSEARVVDLSPKYNADWLNNLKSMRADAKYFDKALSRYLPEEAEQVEEQQEVAELHEQHGLPKVISQFKNHPKYALSRHLLKFEAFYPREPPLLGYCRGEPVYPREAVHTLRSKETWHRLARQVKEGELAYNVVKARPKWNKKTEELMRDLPLEVFGEWQTEPYQPPVAENGIVPRNKFGNVELFHPDMLPIGTVHLKLPGLQRVAAELEIDCVPAVVGFDGVGRGCHPVIEGFVVCVENQEILVEAWNEREREDRHKRRERIRKRAVKNWRKLVSRVIWDLRFKKKYKNELEEQE